MIVRNLEHLKNLSVNKNGDFEDFYIKIANGFARSRKRILYHRQLDEFSIIHEIDESYQEFSSSDIGLKTNLIRAIAANALVKD